MESNQENNTLLFIITIYHLGFVLSKKKSYICVLTDRRLTSFSSFPVTRKSEQFPSAGDSIY